MARYDYDSQLAFAQKQLDDARKRGEKTGKRMAREALKTNVFAGFVNNIYNNVQDNIQRKADLLHMQQGPQLAAYQDYLTTRDNLKNNIAEYTGGTLEGINTDNISRFIYDTWQTKLNEDDAFKGYILPGDMLRAEADKQAITLAPLIKNLIQEGNDIGTLDDFVKNYNTIGKSQNPRTIPQAIIKRLGKIFKTNNEETAQFYDEQAKNAIYGTPFYKEIGELGKAVEAYGQKGNSINEIIKTLSDMKANGQLEFTKEGAQVVDVKIPGYGGDRVEKKLLLVNGDVVDLPGLSSFEPKTPKAFQQKDIDLAFEAISTNPNFKEFTGKDGIITNQPRLISNSILEAASSLGDVTNNSQLINAASIFIGQQLKEGKGAGQLDTMMTAYDLEKTVSIQGDDTSYLREKLLPNFSFYLDDMRNRLDEYDPRILVLYNDYTNYIKSSNMSQDEKIEAQQQINISFNKAPMSNTQFDNTDDTPPAETDKVSRPIKDFIIGDELDITDAFWLIPGFGTLGLAGRATTKIVGPKIVSKILTSNKVKPLVAKYGKQIQKGFKTDKAKADYINQLSPFQKALFNSMSTTGKSVDQSKLLINMLAIPGLSIRAFLPTIGKTIFYGGATAAAVGTSISEQRQDDEDN
tara:strand:- start:3454 stop:5358 length:1905 start_codon:yes stop_codon:yes gene_type:complete